MRKIGYIFLALTNSLLIVTLPTVSHSQPKPIDLTGTWIGNYTCERSGLSEQIEISVTGNYLVAKKTTGDNCVPAGNITFQGTLPDSLKDGISFPVTWTVGNPTNPASGKTVQNLTVLNVNSFTSYGIQFTRVARRAGLQSNASIAGKWQSDWGLVVFNSDLTGYWQQGSGVGKIKDGTYDPTTRKLVFHYYQSWNDMNGTAILTLSEDGNSFSGSWSQQRGSNPPGSGGSGGWTMTRDISTPERAVDRVIQQVKPRVCLPIVGCH